MRRWLFVWTMLLVAMAAFAQTWQADLHLYGAAFSGDTQDPDWPILTVELDRTGDRWERVYIMTADFSRSYEAARVAASRQIGNHHELTLAAPFQRNRASQGGYGEYRVTFDLTADGKIVGNYTGTFRGIPVQGKVDGALVNRTATTVSGYVPVQPGEHPRILFRKADLPALKARMQTPLGQALLPKMTSPSGLGLRYQLTGDATLATAAMGPVDKMIAEGSKSDQYGNNMQRAEQVALAYDMFYDVWPAEYKRKVERYLNWMMALILYAPSGATPRGINWHVCSNWSAPCYTGAGFAGLALYGEKGPAPVEPQAPALREVAPIGKIDLAPGTPVSDFRSGVMPAEWIYAGGFPDYLGGDPLAAVGGAAKFFPVPGAQISFAGKTDTFRALSHEQDKGFWSPNAETPLSIDINHAVGREMFTTNYFYTVVRNDAPRWVQVNSDGSTIYLAGVALKDGDCVKLAGGTYPMLVVAPYTYTVDWGRSLIRPRLTEITAEQAQQALADQQASYQRAHADWAYDQAEWTRLGGQNIEYLTRGDMCTRLLYLFCREAVGTGGEQAEISHYGEIAYEGPARFASAFKAMFGRDLSPYNDIAMVMPRKMMMHFYGIDGRTAVQEINSQPDIWAGHFAGGFNSVPDAYKPAVLWAWNRLAKVTAADPVAGLTGGDPVYTFLFYPQGMTAKAPKDVMPLTWQAPDFGSYIFRNKWDGTDDIIFQTWVRAHNIGGWNGPNAATFRLFGLGQVWAWGQHDRNRFRWEENVVQLPEDEQNINLGALGRVTYLKTEPDGSGSLSMDLNDLYAGRGTGPQYSRYGGFRNPLGFKDNGISGMRAVAVDYSGRSGAPCLLVIVDKIAGGKTKVWTWNLDRGDRDNPGDVTRTRVEGKTFTITKGDASLRGTFISPAAMTLTAETKAKFMIGGAASTAGKQLDRPIPGVFAESQDGTFFCVVTLQKGPAPEVKVEGEGLNAVVTVGRRTVRFDGQKIIFGE